MIAYKFLRSGRIGPFSGYRWPEPGAWVDASGTDPCRRGVHACRTADLPWWLADELWEIELVDSAPALALEIPSARIILTIAGDGAYRAVTGAPPTSAYIAAHAALRLDRPAGYAAERVWQSQWLVQRLGLTEIE